jgi:hypothetical protein
LRQITSAAKESFPGSAGAGITLLDPNGDRVTAAATDALVERADALQYELGQGPCLAAWEQRTVVCVHDLEREDRWPDWVRAVTGTGLRSSLSAPLTTDGEALGALKVYGSEPAVHGKREEHLLTMFATQAAILLANVRTAEDAERISDDLKDALRGRDVIALAKGILMARDSADERAAFLMLTDRAQRRRMTLREAAEHLVPLDHPPTPLTAMTDHSANHRANPDPSADRQRHSIAAALRHSGLTTEELWIRYFALGGDTSLTEVDAYVHGLGGLPPLQRDALAHAVNEHLDELTPPHRADYSRLTRETKPSGRSLSALVALLEGAELAPPDRLTALVDAAAHALDVRITMYLVDYEERHLHRWPAGGAPHDSAEDGARLGVDSTLAGRAFRQVRILSARSPDHPRLWVPLLDGVERLGVLEVRVDDASDLHDPGLRTQCRWLSMLLGHLVALLNQYGDAVDLVRQATRRTVGGELIWSLLPPPTAGVDSFVVTGVVEPRHGVNGDAFDYALSETTATLIVLDAVGHNLRSGLIAATALAAHRHARHTGQDLGAQARTIDETISTQFGPSTFVTAVLAEVDLATGRLRYLNAGHPEPLIMRGGRVVKPLTGGRTPPLGVGFGDRAVAEEVLQPDDWLVLYTDGITEARNAHGEFFGETRLNDFLHREAASGNPPPETARRLIQAILAHQGGVFQDDATVVLARWTNPEALLL